MSNQSPCVAFRDEVCEHGGRAFPMKSRFSFLLAAISTAFIAVTPVTVSAKSDAEQICVSVGRLLEEAQSVRLVDLLALGCGDSMTSPLPQLASRNFGRSEG